MKTQADYFKQADLKIVDTQILTDLYVELSPLCNHLVPTTIGSYGYRYKYNNEDFWKKGIDYKDLLKPILNKVGLKKRSDLRNKLKEYYKYGGYNKSLIINRIVSIIKKELAIRIVELGFDEIDVVEVDPYLTGKKHKLYLISNN